MLSLRGARAGTLRRCTLDLEPGLHVVLGQEQDGTGDLVELLAGARAPRSGSVTVLGRQPHRSPTLRRDIAALRQSEELFPARTAGEALRIALAARGVPVTAEQALDEAGLRHWAPRAPSKLDLSERRTLAACMALARPKPPLAVLHEPLAYLPGLSSELMLRRITSWVAEGSLVLCTTSSPSTAQLLGGRAWILEQSGAVRPLAASNAVELAPGQPATLLIRTSGARELAAALSRAAGVTASAFDETLQHAQVRVQGSEARALSRTVVRVARELGIPVEAIVPSVPDLEVMRAANAGYLRAAYDAAYYRAQVEQRPPARSDHASS
jgi:ABC-type multidrug transport system ATPase subunit